MPPEPVTSLPFDAVDLFAGPGGWDVAAHGLGLHVVGLELDRSACATRAAAGLATIRCDVSRTPTHRFRGIRGLIGSPPCQMFSQAGKGVGRLVMAELAEAIRDAVAGRPRRAHHRRRIARALRGVQPGRWTRCERSAEAWRQARNAMLVVEVARFAHDLAPEWIALEQVPAVLPLWKVLAHELDQQHGYRTWCGVLNAADFGVPQTRQRAILMAHRTRAPQPPAATHCRGGSDPDLFGPGLEPWVSMAAALGWGATAIPYPTIACSRSTGGPDVEKVGGSGARATIHAEHDEGRWVLRTGCNSMSMSRDPEDMVPYERSVDEPAPTIREQSHAWKVAPEGEHHDPPMRWKVNTGRDCKDGGSREDAQTFDPDEQPAPTIDGKGRWHVERVELRRGGDRIEEGFDPEAEPAATVTTRVNRWQGVELVPGGPGMTGRDGSKGSNRSVRTADEPAPTVAFWRDAAGWEWRERRHDQDGTSQADPEWPLERPATTVAGRPLVADPGHTVNAGDDAARTKTRNDGFRVELWEAAVLQSFPADYPWRGTRSKQFEQVGNAVPPGLAGPVLAALTDAPEA